MPLSEIVHHQLNPGSCFRKPAISASSPSIPTLHVDQLISQLAQKIHRLISEKTRLNEGHPFTTDVLKRKFRDHFHQNYAPNTIAGQTLIMRLQWLNALLNNQLAETHVHFNPELDATPLAEKICEGLVNCTDGFLNRINSLIEAIVIKSNFPEFLLKYRTDILHMVTTQFIANTNSDPDVNLHIPYSIEAHVPNTISKIAAHPYLDLGINIINPHDNQDGFNDQIRTRRAVEMLISAYKLHYTPLLIIQNIEAQINTQLLNAGYHGKPEVEEGYSNYLSWNDLLNSIFPNPQNAPRPITYWLMTNTHLSPDEAFEQDIEYKVTNVNWPLIREHIFKQLIAEKHFIGPEFSESCSLNEALQPNPLNDRELNYWLNNIATLSELKQHFNRFNLTQNIEADIETFFHHANQFSNNHLFLNRISEMLVKYIHNTPITVLKTNRFFKQFISSELKSALFAEFLAQLEPSILQNILDETSSSFSFLKMIAQHQNPALLTQLLNVIQAHPNLIERFQEQNYILVPILQSLYANKNHQNILSLIQFAKQHINEPLPYQELQIRWQLNDNELIQTILAETNINHAVNLLKIAGELRLPHEQAIPLHRLLIGSFIQNTSNSSQLSFALLKHISTKPKAEQIQIYRQTINRDTNLLMIAVANQSAQLQPLLKSLEEVSDQALIETMVTQASGTEQNPLMTIISRAPYKPASFLSMIHFIQKNLSIEKQRHLLLHNFSWGYFLQLTESPAEILLMLELQEKLDIKANWDNKAEIQNILLLNADSLTQRISAGDKSEAITLMTLALRTSPASQHVELFNAFLFVTVTEKPELISWVLDQLTQDDTLTNDERLALFIQPNMAGDNLLMATAKSNPDDLKMLLEYVRHCNPVAVCDCLGSIKLSVFNKTEDILYVLRLMKENGYLHPITYRERNMLYRRLSAEDWYHISHEELLPTSVTKNKKEIVFNHITHLEGQERKDSISESIDHPEKGLGKLFWTQRGFFKCRTTAGNLKKLVALRAQDEDPISYKKTTI